MGEQDPVVEKKPSNYLLSEEQREIYRRFARLALPRHTSYPIAAVWTPTFGPAQFATDLATGREAGQPVSLYVHIPFCQQLCYYCACTKEIIPPQKRRECDPAEGLLEHLELEAGRIANLLGPRPVEQLHLGGGSPTFLTPAQLERLGEILARHFVLTNHGERAVEVDPRVTTREHLETLRGLGFNRISLGVQDFSPRVQQAVHRQQPFEMVQQCVETVRSLGFGSINFDLIYGLPFQTLDSMADTLEKTLRLAPDRVAFYRLAVIPEIFRWQNVFRPDDLPGGDIPLDLNLLAIQTFLEAGYDFIGLDHFARPDEALFQAREAGTLRRNFQGMTTRKDLEIVGLGPSAISQLESAFAQNHKDTADWSRAVRADLGTERGMHLTVEDRLRQEVLQQLYGHGEVDLGEPAARLGLSYAEAFADDLPRLDDLSGEGLLTRQGSRLHLTTPLGRLLVRVVASVFDRYLPRDAYRNGLPSQQASRVG
ncbi:MAG: oxygen-independent coproporphyrinogen III oxidase [Gemmataceae bacterium]